MNLSNCCSGCCSCRASWASGWPPPPSSSPAPYRAGPMSERVVNPAAPRPRPGWYPGGGLSALKSMRGRPARAGRGPRRQGSRRTRFVTIGSNKRHKTIAQSCIAVIARRDRETRSETRLCTERPGTSVLAAMRGQPGVHEKFMHPRHHSPGAPEAPALAPDGPGRPGALIAALPPRSGRRPPRHGAGPPGRYYTKGLPGVHERAGGRLWRLCWAGKARRKQQAQFSAGQGPGLCV